MKTTKKIIMIVAVAAFVSGNVYSAATKTTTKSPAKATSDAKSTAKADEAEEKKKKSSPFGASVGYSISTNFAEELKPRLYRHNVSVGASYKVKDYFSLSFSTGYFFRSLDNSISKFEEDSGISNISFGISRGISQPLGKFAGAEHKISAGVSGSLPMMEDDRIEGSRGSIGIGPRVSSKFFDGLFSVSNRVYYRFIFNKFEFSPISNNPTAQAAYGYSLGASVPIIGKLSAGLGFGMRRTRFTDGFRSFSYSNSQSLSYSLGKMSMSVSHSNGGFTGDGNVELWYIDKYRRLMSASLGYSF